MASEVQIANRALQKLGAKRITSLTQDTPNARSCNVAYADLRDAELRAHPWNFAIKRVQLAKDVTAPEFGRASSFQLPSDFLRLMPKYPEDRTNAEDWQIEGKKIYTDDSDPLNVRYIAQVTDPNDMDSLFREALSTRIALELCEEITQSNTKKQLLMDDHKRVIAEARRNNAIENVPAESPEDTWLSERR